MSGFSTPCPQSQCEFVGKGSSLSHARSAVGGHALRQHGAMFVGEACHLRIRSSSELAFELERFRHQQRNSRDSRRANRLHVAASGAGLAGVVPGDFTGLAAPASPGPFSIPDLSTGQLEDWQIPPDLALGLPDLAMEAAPAMMSSSLRAPLLMAFGEMVDHFLFHSGRRPSSLASELVCQSARTEDQNRLGNELYYWFQVLSGVQRSIASSLLEEVRSALNNDPTGRLAFEFGMAEMQRLERHPLDLNED